MVRYQSAPTDSLRELKNSKETRGEEDKNLNRKEGEMRTLLRKIKFRKFKRVFGFVPSKEGQGSVESRNAEQYIVDDVLERLAERFDSLCKQGKLHYPSGHKWGELYEVRLYEIQGEFATLYLDLQAAERAFRRAHKLAREAGFSVKAEYSDYLPLAKYG